MAALEAAAEKTARAASAAKDAAVAASAAATDAAGAAKEAVVAALATAEQAAAASSTAKEAAMAMRYSNKRRFHQTDDEETGGANRDDGGSLDLISLLPDDVLGTIISRLSTKDGARTQAISLRWLPLWRSAPLNLEVRFSLFTDNTKLIASVSKILSEHRGHARRLSLQFFNPNEEVPAGGWERKIDGWLRSQALDSVEELEFTYRHMPLSVFRFAPTLRVARFSDCNFPESVSRLSLNFPCLKQLTLCMVFITNDTLHIMLSGCTALESLELSQCYCIGGLSISSQTLRSLVFSTGPLSDRVISQLVIEDAPCLERLLPLHTYNGRVTIQVNRAPKLETLGVLSQGISVFQFGTTIFQVAAAFIHRSLAFLYACYYSCLHCFSCRK